MASGSLGGYPPSPPQSVPLSAKFLAAELPQHFRCPNIGGYNGRGDHDDYFSRFENASLLHKYNDPIKCRVFFNTLGEAVQQWFGILESGSVRTFQDFRRMFSYRFASSKKQPLTTLSLFTMKQQNQESLRAYVHRFNAKMVQVPSATPDLLISTLVQGLKPEDLFTKDCWPRR